MQRYWEPYFHLHKLRLPARAQHTPSGPPCPNRLPTIARLGGGQQGEGNGKIIESGRVGSERGVNSRRIAWSRRTCPPANSFRRVVMSYSAGRSEGPPVTSGNGVGTRSPSSLSSRRRSNRSRILRPVPTRQAFAPEGERRTNTGSTSHVLATSMQHPPRSRCACARPWRHERPPWKVATSRLQAAPRPTPRQ